MLVVVTDFQTAFILLGGRRALTDAPYIDISSALDAVTAGQSIRKAAE